MAVKGKALKTQVFSVQVMH